MEPQNLTIPMKVDAFILNASVCNGTSQEAKIAPITQPDYSGLCLDGKLLRNDLLDHVNLCNTTPASSNSRLTDLGRGVRRENRVGVYLHWILPRFYRIGSAATPTAESSLSSRLLKNPSATSPTLDSPDYSTPNFPRLPNRWLVIRRLAPGSIVPANAQIEPVEAWVIESDRLHTIDDAFLDGKDLQVDASPYTSPNMKLLNGIKIGDMSDVFIGSRQPASGWTEDPGAARADLTVASSSNPLFADYQYHCSNVFSMVDNFACTIDGKPCNLTEAHASYYVIGWHSNDTDGPLGDLSALSNPITRRARLQSLSMALHGEGPGPASSEATDRWLSSKKSASVLCHGSIYDVAWNVNERPQKMPANDYAHAFFNDMPIAVGTTPMDAFLAYVDAHQGDYSKDPLMADLHLLGPLLRAQDDGVEAARAAADEVQNWNFARLSGGKHWHIQSPANHESIEEPNSHEIEQLEKLNQAQSLLDTTCRQLSQLRWELFSSWWQFMSLPWSGAATFPNRNNFTADRHVEKLSQRILDTISLASAQKNIVSQLSQDTTSFRQLPKAEAKTEFFQPRDPTLLIAGAQAGWPDDYLDTLRVRLDTQLIALDSQSKSAMNWSAYCTDRLPVNLRDTAQALIEEFVALDPYAQVEARGDEGHFYPLYHDFGKHADPSRPRRDQWDNEQPWFPLFLEWEAEYFHIPWERWKLQKMPSKLSEPQWRFDIAEGINLSDEPRIDDVRTLSGRIFLLPQPNFSLQTEIDKLFNSVNADVLDTILTPEQRQEVRDKVSQLPLLSAPLDGLIDHLLTLMHGAHIRPNARYPLQGAVRPLSDAMPDPYDWERVLLIGDVSDATPYGSLVPLPEGVEAPPFKPVAHGQFRFTKLNIIDKFGQAVHAMEPSYKSEGKQAIYPCISDRVVPPRLSDNQPNVVRPPAQAGACEFVQICPQINQPIRLNASFMIHDTRHDTDPKTYSYWRPTTEWENPVWGWMVLNYVDYGLQIYLPDGTFYREVRLSAPTAPKRTTISAKWLPFEPPENPPDTGQLDPLLDKFMEADQQYLLSFIHMASKSLESTSSAPSTYASFIQSVVGRPLALVNAGWSLELATDARRNQSHPHGQPSQAPSLPLVDAEETYMFPVKLGDVDRASDGLVGYFNTLSSPKVDDDIDLSKIYTYCTDEPATGPLQPVTDGTIPRLRCFWLDPQKYLTCTTPGEAAAGFTKDWNDQFAVFGTIIDPFSPITAYSSILPIVKLQLPPWTWEKALRKMTAFFHMGPILVPEDVGKNWNPEHTLQKDYDLNSDKDPTVPGSAVEMPSLGAATWNWLQPYFDDGRNTTEYMALGLGKVDERPKFEKGPYTAIEGYLQMKQPIVGQAVKPADGDEM